MSKTKLLVACFAVGAAFSLGAEAKLYKWVDEHGTTHYGETIPPEYAGRETQKLDKGRVTNRDDTFDAIKKSGKQEKAEDKDTVEAKRRDNALLNSYSNEKEIDLARDRNLLQIEARINSYATLLKSAQATLNDLYQERDERTKSGRKVQQSLIDDIANAEARVANMKKDLDSNQKEADAVRARYEADKQRFRQLKGLAAPADNSSKPEPAKQ